MATFSLQTLKEAIQIKEQIERLEARLGQIFGSTASTSKVPAKAAKSPVTTGRRKMSPAGRARIAAAARARWAMIKAKPAKKAATPAKAVKSAKPAKAAQAPRKKGGLTPEGRARLVASMKARWAARKAQPEPTPEPAA